MTTAHIPEIHPQATKNFSSFARDSGVATSYFTTFVGGLFGV
jgi:hypothetical protein